MGDIEKYQYGNIAFFITGEGKRIKVFYKNHHQTLRITWQDPKYPQSLALRKLAKSIRSGTIQTTTELLLSIPEGKLVAVNVGNWYKEITG